MIRSLAPKLGAYLGLGAFGLLAALVLGRPELAVVAAPFALVAGLGIALAPQPRIRVSVALDRERALEGDDVEAEVVVQSSDLVEHLEVALILPPGIGLAEGDNPVLLRLNGRVPHTLLLGLRCDRWGGYVLGDVALRARDPFALFTYEQRVGGASRLRVYPRPEELRQLLPPLETQVFTGNQVSRTKGEGIEFADMRPFVPGDRVRRVNWRASARRGGLWVNESHPERNTDVIVFLDAFTEARGEGARGTLDMAVRAAATLAGRYLQRKDRVGLVSFGGVLAWLLPSTGPIQVYRVVESLIDTEITLSYAWKDVDVIPRRTLPPKALILAVTPLLDERAVGTLLDLRARGFDRAVLEVSPVPFVAPGPTEIDALAHRLWLMKRRRLRAQYERVGVPVVEWREGTPLAAPVEEVTAWRRLGRRALVS